MPQGIAGNRLAALEGGEHSARLLPEPDPHFGSWGKELSGGLRKRIQQFTKFGILGQRNGRSAQGDATSPSAATVENAIFHSLTRGQTEEHRVMQFEKGPAVVGLLELVAVRRDGR